MTGQNPIESINFSRKFSCKRKFNRNKRKCSVLKRQNKITELVIIIIATKITVMVSDINIHDHRLLITITAILNICVILHITSKLYYIVLYFTATINRHQLLVIRQGCYHNQKISDKISDSVNQTNLHKMIVRWHSEK